MGTKPRGLPTATLVLSEILYANLAVDTYYESLQLSDVEVAYSPKNKIIRDIAEIIEQLSLDINKAKEEVLFTADIVKAELIKKASTDIYNVFDTNKISIDKNVYEYTSLTDAIAVFLQRTFREVIVASDTCAVGLSTPRHDTQTVEDAFTLRAEYQRHVQDFLTLDDWSLVDKYYNGAKRNFVGVNDAALVSLVKSYSDYYNISDTPSILLSRAVLESLSTSDVFNFATEKPVNEFIGVQDKVTPSLLRPVSDAAGIYDQNTLNVLKNHLDPISLTETRSLNSVLRKSGTVQHVTVYDIINIGITRYLGSDIVGVGDFSTMAVTKEFNEILSTTDQNSKGVVKRILDVVYAQDAFNFDYSTAIDDSVTMSDYSEARKFRTNYPQDFTSTTDLLKTNTSKQLIDLVGTTSYNRLHFLSKVEEVLSITDSVQVTIARSTSVLGFNESLFNQSTFG